VVGGGNMGKDEESKIRNKISIAKPHFSLSIETDESLTKSKKIFEELMEKYRR